MRALINMKFIAALVAVLIAGGLVLEVRGAPGTRTVTAHFSNAVSIFEGSEVSVMGVPIGSVVEVDPQGDEVEVVMEYDAEYELPADVQAVIVTPTLVSDRFVQLTPAYTEGATLENKASIPMERTAVPVEMDRIYKSLNELTEALGPNGANKNGALNEVLSSGSKALQGNGARGNQLIRDLAEVSKTLGGNSKEMFGTIEELAALSKTLDANEKTVEGFVTDLSKVSTQLSGERKELRRALTAIAEAVDVTHDFVKNNKQAVVGSVDRLNETTEVLAKQRKTLGKVIQLAPLGLGNLADAFDPATGSVGIRLQLSPILPDLPNILCAAVVNNKLPNADGICALFKALVPKAPTTDEPLLAGSTTAENARAGTAGASGGDLKSLVGRAETMAGEDR